MLDGRQMTGVKRCFQINRILKCMGTGQRQLGEAKVVHLGQDTLNKRKEMFVGCFSSKGLWRLANVEGKMNNDKYKAVMQAHLHNFKQNDYADGEDIFQQQLTSCHTS